MLTIVAKIKAATKVGIKEKNMPGIHHVTAIAGDPLKNFDFYMRDLGLRLVKKTVNFDDPSTYHFYYGDETGSPGTILTFFPWARARPDGAVSAKRIRPPSASRSARSATGPSVSSKREFPMRPGEALRRAGAALYRSGWDGARARRRRRCRKRARLEQRGRPSEHAIRGFQGVTLLLDSAAEDRRDPDRCVRLSRGRP